MKGRTVALNQLAGFVGKLLRVLEKDFDRLDRHRRIGIDRNAWNLSVLHEAVQQEEKLLGSLDRKRRHDNAAPALSRIAYELRHSRAGIVVRVRPVSVGRLHDQNVGRLALGRSGMHDLAGCGLAVAHAAYIAREQADALPSVHG